MFWQPEQISQQHNEVDVDLKAFPMKLVYERVWQAFDGRTGTNNATVLFVAATVIQGFVVCESKRCARCFVATEKEVLKFWNHQGNGETFDDVCEIKQSLGADK